VKRFVYVFGVVCYILAGTVTVGLAGDFFFSIFLGRLSPWWFWLLGLLSVGVLTGLVLGLISSGKKNRLIF
jgi:hypothetical protein